MRGPGTPLGAFTACLAAVCVSAVIAAGPQALDATALDQALRLARTRQPSELDRFTLPYLIVGGAPGSPTVEVITEYRRAVMLARQQVDQGNFSWSPRNLSQAVAKYEGLTTVRAEVWLPVTHAYVTTPPYRMDLYTAANRTVGSVQEKREPIYSTLLSEQPSMTGVALEWMYRADVLQEPGCCLLVLVDPRGETIVRQQIAFANLR
jgi:hypothetical protein